MLATTYLKLPVVEQFVDWLAGNLDKDTLSHRYHNRRTGPWQCASLHDAYCQYTWPASTGTTFDDNAVDLDKWKSALQHALTPLPDDAAACAATTGVMGWGGVQAGNVLWLHTNQTGLAKTLIEVRNALDSGNIDTLAHSLRFNAGMTKVYSLLCRSLIIYDSRVAAALGWAVTLFCQDRQLTTVPAALDFPWAPAKNAPDAANPKWRNPSTAGLIFQSLKSGVLHAKWNMRASWLLEAVLAHAKAQTSQFAALPGQTRLRAVEAALFMIGYDLPTCASALPAPTVKRRCAMTTLGDDWHECLTKGHRVNFHYRITSKGVRTQPGRLFPIATINATLEYLRANLKGAPFPLANHAVKARQPSAALGLGHAYFATTGRNPPDTSKLAAVLEDLQLIQRVAVPGNGNLHWRISPALLATSDGIDITPWVDEFLKVQSEV
ncbi:hypothetical protein [Pseudomonas soli]|uniref:hypothetical protein n=1 Tax=Pseudomonas soli TaxID=1306993 RepID=UPI00299DBD16|nr:hypothetical protein [Pseudomonas soli]